MKNLSIVGVFLLISIIVLSNTHAASTASISAGELELISNTEQCLTDCSALVKFVPNYDITLGKEIIEFEYGEGASEVESYSLNILQDSTCYSTGTPIYSQFVTKSIFDLNVDGCPANYLPKVTTCEKDIITNKITSFEQVPYGCRKEIDGKKPLLAGETYYLEITIKRKAKLGSNPLDWILNIGGEKIDQWAWVYSGWTKRRCFTITNNSGVDVNAGYPKDLNILQFNFNSSAICSQAKKYDCLGGMTFNSKGIPLNMESIDGNKAWFKLQAGLAAGATTATGEAGYCLYYSNTSAAAPTFKDSNFMSPALDKNYSGLDKNITLAMYHLRGDEKINAADGNALMEIGSIDSNTAVKIYDTNSAGGFSNANHFRFPNILNGLSTFTIELDFYDNGKQADNYAYLINYGWGSAGSVQITFIDGAAWGSRAIHFQGNGCGAVSYNSPGSGRWHHLIAIAEPAGAGWRMNIDDNWAPSAVGCTTTAGNHTGHIGIKDADNWFNGQIQNVRISNYAVDPRYFPAVANGGQPNPTSFKITLAAEENAIPLDANFSYTISPSLLDLENGISSITVNFTDISDYNGGTLSPTGWRWDFNGTIYSTDQNISKAFTAVADYNVCLDVNATGGGVDYNNMACRILSIQQTPQGISFTYDVNQYTQTKADVNFHGAGTGVESWTWKMNGVLFSTLQHDDYNFTAAGDYNACLLATKLGQTKTTCQHVYVTKVTVKVPKSEFDQNSLSPFSFYAFSSPNQTYSALTADANLFLVSSSASGNILVQIDYIEALFYSRYYDITTDGTAQTLQPYLIPVSGGTSMTLIAQNSLTLARIPNVTVEIYRYISGSPTRTLVEIVTTDFKGEALISGITNYLYELDVYYAGTLVDSVNITITGTTVVIAFVPGTVTPPQTGGVIGCQFTPIGGKLPALQGNVKIAVSFEGVSISQIDVNARLADDYNANYDRNLFYRTYTSIANGWNQTYSLATDLVGWTDANYSLRLEARITISDGNVFYCHTIYYRSDMNRMGDMVLDILRNGLPADMGCKTGQACGITIILSLFITFLAVGIIITSTPFRQAELIIPFALVLLGFFVVINWLDIFLFALIAIGGVGSLVMLFRRGS